VHQVARYDIDHGISYWTKNYHTAIDADDDLALSREYPYYDPIYMLPESGQAWWRSQRALNSQLSASAADIVTLAGSGQKARQAAV
jgi:lysine 2,3-aminomutase